MSPEFAKSINRHIPFVLSRITTTTTTTATTATTATTTTTTTTTSTTTAKRYVGVAQFVVQCISMLLRGRNK
jgi:hypothetical protein